MLRGQEEKEIIDDEKNSVDDSDDDDDDNSGSSSSSSGSSGSGSGSDSDSNSSDSDDTPPPPIIRDPTPLTAALSQCSQFLLCRSASRLASVNYALSLSVPEHLLGFVIRTRRLTGLPSRLRALMTEANTRRSVGRLPLKQSAIAEQRSLQKLRAREARTAAQVASLCGRFRDVRKVEVSGSRLSPASLTALASLRGLTSLVLSRSVLLPGPTASPGSDPMWPEMQTETMGPETTTGQGVGLPDAFGGLASLERLVLHRCEGFADLSPLGRGVGMRGVDGGSASSSALASLTELDVSHTAVSDLAPLSACGGSLTSLKAAGCSGVVSGKGWLPKLRKLERLHLEHSGLTDVKCLAFLTALRVLVLDGTPVNSLQPLAKRVAPTLEHLSVALTPVRFVDALGSATSRLTSLNLSASAIRHVTPLRHCKALSRLNLSRTDLKDGDVLFALLGRGLGRLVELRLSGGRCVDATDVALGQGGPGGRDRRAMLATTPVVVKFQRLFRERRQLRRTLQEQERHLVAAATSSSSDDDDSNSDSDSDDGDSGDSDGGGNGGGKKRDTAAVSRDDAAGDNEGIGDGGLYYGGGDGGYQYGEDDDY